jgi:hypothetical protein
MRNLKMAYNRGDAAIKELRREIRASAAEGERSRNGYSPAELTYMLMQVLLQQIEVTLAQPSLLHRGDQLADWIEHSKRYSNDD